MTKPIYVTGPRGENYGYGEGVMLLTDAEKYIGLDAEDDGEIWDILAREDWNFDEDEDELEAEGRLGMLLIRDGRFALSVPRNGG